MTNIAIDIVLLPPVHIMDEAIAINNSIVNDPIVLSKSNCLPHISLCMGVVTEENLPKMHLIVKKIASNFSKLSLNSTRINGDKCCFEFEKNSELQKLHETIMVKLDSFLTYDATTSMCVSPPVVAEKTLYWINGYKQKSSFQDFYPYITLGVSKISSSKVNINFTTSTLAICHLGNYCTCRKILYSTTDFKN